MQPNNTFNSMAIRFETQKKINYISTADIAK